MKNPVFHSEGWVWLAGRLDIEPLRSQGNVPLRTPFNILETPVSRTFPGSDPSVLNN